jgi:hypothetical protein
MLGKKKYDKYKGKLGKIWTIRPVGDRDVNGML